MHLTEASNQVISFEKVSTEYTNRCVLFEQLFELTKYGLGAVLGDKSFKTRMPVYKDILSDVDVVAVLSYIKSRWPKDIQKRHDKLNAARRRSN